VASIGCGMVGAERRGMIWVWQDIVSSDEPSLLLSLRTRAVRDPEECILLKPMG
jgi:hypothetical protein